MLFQLAWGFAPPVGVIVLAYGRGDTALGFSTAVGVLVSTGVGLADGFFSEKYRGTALCGRHERTGRVKLNFFGSLSPSPAHSTTLSGSTPTHPLNRLEKHYLRLLTPYSLEAEHNAVNVVRLKLPLFDWAAA